MIKYAGEGMAAGLDGVLCPSSNRGGWQQGFAVACVHRRELNVDVAFPVSPSRKGALATVVSPLSGYAITNHSTGCIWIGCGRDMRKAPDHALLWGRGALGAPMGDRRGEQFDSLISAPRRQQSRHGRPGAKLARPTGQ